MENVSEEVMLDLIGRGHNWLLQQRDVFKAKGRPLSDEEKFPLGGYFDAGTLDRVRLAVVDRISNPAFYDEMKALEYQQLDISTASAIAFIDCVLIGRRYQAFPSLWTSILFHELVHVVQYELLGTRQTIESYIRTWFENWFNYDGTPLEAQAQRLASRFDRHEPPFAVREVVGEELKHIL
ncbi:hypothetical protein ACFLX5_02520 [Chloroflexota bacterium]